jgi:hypothetical protein
MSKQLTESEIDSRLQGLRSYLTRKIHNQTFLEEEGEEMDRHRLQTFTLALNAVDENKALREENTHLKNAIAELNLIQYLV